MFCYLLMYICMHYLYVYVYICNTYVVQYIYIYMYIYLRAPESICAAGGGAPGPREAGGFGPIIIIIIIIIMIIIMIMITVINSNNNNNSSSSSRARNPPSLGFEPRTSFITESRNLSNWAVGATKEKTRELAKILWTFVSTLRACKDTADLYFIFENHKSDCERHESLQGYCELSAQRWTKTGAVSSQALRLCVSTSR